MKAAFLLDRKRAPILFRALGMWLAITAMQSCAHTDEGALIQTALRRDCAEDTDCVLEKDPLCGGTVAIRAGQGDEWKDYTQGETQLLHGKPPACTGKEHEPKFYTPHCVEWICQAWPRPVKP